MYGWFLEVVTAGFVSLALFAPPVPSVQELLLAGPSSPLAAGTNLAAGFAAFMYPFPSLTLTAAGTGSCLGVLFPWGWINCRRLEAIQDNVCL